MQHPAPGSSAVLPPPSPLRTTRARFPRKRLKPFKRPVRNAASRMGEEALQGFHLAPSPLLCCLDDTRLEPTHCVMRFLPVDSMPLIATVGSCTSSCCCRHLLCLLCLFPKLFRHERPDGSLPACAWGTIVLPRNPYPNDYRLAFASSILPYPHACRLALQFAFPNGRHVGLPRSVYVPTDGLGPACSPVAVLSTVREGRSSSHLATYLLVQACQRL